MQLLTVQMPIKAKLSPGSFSAPWHRDGCCMQRLSDQLAIENTLNTPRLCSLLCDTSATKHVQLVGSSEKERFLQLCLGIILTATYCHVTLQCAISCLTWWDHSGYSLSLRPQQTPQTQCGSMLCSFIFRSEAMKPIYIRFSVFICYESQPIG